MTYLISSILGTGSNYSFRDCIDYNPTDILLVLPLFIVQVIGIVITITQWYLVSNEFINSNNIDESNDYLELDYYNNSIAKDMLNKSGSSTIKSG